MTDRLYRSPTDRVIAGVAGGLAAWLQVIRPWCGSPVVLAVLSGGIFLLVYLVMMIVVPLPPPGWVPSTVHRHSRARPDVRPAGWPVDAAARWPVDAAAIGGRIVRHRRRGRARRGRRPTRPTPASSSGSSSSRLRRLVPRRPVHPRIDWQLVWPVIVIVVGAALIIGAMRRNRPTT